MPRLTTQQYIDRYMALHRLWFEHRASFRLISTQLQRYLHDYSSR